MYLKVTDDVKNGDRELAARIFDRVVGGLLLGKGVEEARGKLRQAISDGILFDLEIIENRRDDWCPSIIARWTVEALEVVLRELWVLDDEGGFVRCPYGIKKKYDIKVNDLNNPERNVLFEADV